MTTAELDYAILDLQRVIEIWERAFREGIGHNLKLGTYWDQLHECLHERARRRRTNRQHPAA